MVPDLGCVDRENVVKMGKRAKSEAGARCKTGVEPGSRAARTDAPRLLSYCIMKPKIAVLYIYHTQHSCAIKKTSSRICCRATSGAQHIVEPVCSECACGVCVTPRPRLPRTGVANPRTRSASLSHSHTLQNWSWDTVCTVIYSVSFALPK
jgi:hypothetical protein